VTKQLEPWISDQMLDVGARPGEEIVDTNHVRPIGEQLFANMRTQESSSTRHQNLLLKVHLIL
jgi:hypothetical protein